MNASASSPDRRPDAGRCTDSELSVKVVRFDDPVAQGLLSEYNAELADVVPGFSPTSGSVAPAAEFDSPRGAFVVAFSGPDAVGCGGIRGLTPSIAEIKRLFVRREARGQGLASAMLVALEEQATELGYGEVRLDTHAAGPVGLFQAAGYCAMPKYNDNPYARYWFRKRLPIPATCVSGFVRRQRNLHDPPIDSRPPSIGRNCT
jgi:GNAT superfamily N-acetyltransferase